LEFLNKYLLEENGNRQQSASFQTMSLLFVFWPTFNFLGIANTKYVHGLKKVSSV
jgi:hypothetical protein